MAFNFIGKRIRLQVTEIFRVLLPALYTVSNVLTEMYFLRPLKKRLHFPASFIDSSSAYISANIIHDDAPLPFSFVPSFRFRPFFVQLQFSLSSSLSLRSGFPLATATAAAQSTPLAPVSLILSARFTSGIRSSKQINCTTPLELIGEPRDSRRKLSTQVHRVFHRFPSRIVH